MVNKVTLIGNLGRDPELFQTQNGRAAGGPRQRPPASSATSRSTFATMRSRAAS
jgi:single-stranded DNA-binding protein